jgi:hypothetical protein
MRWDGVPENDGTWHEGLPSLLCAFCSGLVHLCLSRAPDRGSWRHELKVEMGWRWGEQSAG